MACIFTSRLHCCFINHDGKFIMWFSLHKMFWWSVASHKTSGLIVKWCVSFFSRLPQIYEEFYHTVNNADHEKDLKWWSNTHGVNMGMNWPFFEVNTFSLFAVLEQNIAWACFEWKISSTVLVSQFLILVLRTLLWMCVCNVIWCIFLSVCFVLSACKL